MRTTGWASASTRCAPLITLHSAPSTSIFNTLGAAPWSNSQSRVMVSTLTVSRTPPVCVDPPAAARKLAALPRCATLNEAIVAESKTAAGITSMGAEVDGCMAADLRKSAASQMSGSMAITLPPTPARCAAAIESKPTFAPMSHTTLPVCTNSRAKSKRSDFVCVFQRLRAASGETRMGTDPNSAGRCRFRMRPLLRRSINVRKGFIALFRALRFSDPIPKSVPLDGPTTSCNSLARESAHCRCRTRNGKKQYVRAMRPLRIDSALARQRK